MDLATKEDIDALKASIADIFKCMSDMRQKLVISDVLYVSDIARIEDLSVSGIKKCPWLLPNFGKSEYPEGRVRWTTETVKKWRTIPVSERISMYRQYMRNK